MVDLRCLLLTVSAAAALPMTGLADDLIVDKNGGPGTFKTIQAAMTAAQNGDRILVMPGTYPGFEHTKSVSVYGMGASPDDVTVAGIAFHPIYPHTGYRVRLSRMTVVGEEGFGSAALSGNELGWGVLELESMIIDGGVFLGVFDPSGFYLSVSNSEVRTDDPSQGFEGSAVTVRGPGVQVDVSRSMIRGSDGTLSPFAFPLAGLTIDKGAALRISQSEIVGGGGAFIQDGAPGLVVRDGRVEGITGGASLRGGDADLGYTGGAAIQSDSPVPVGDATLAGGDGFPNGATVSGDGTVQSMETPSVQLTLAIDGGDLGPASVRPGSVMDWTMIRDGGTAVALASSFQVTAKDNIFQGIHLDPTANLVLGHGDHVEVPALPGILGLFMTTQALVLDAPAGVVHSSAPTTIRVDG